MSSPVTTAYVGLEYEYDVQATGSGTVSISAPYGLPPWLTLTSTGNGTARLSGTPGSSDSGASVTLLAQDSSCAVFALNCYELQTFAITLVPDGAPTVVAPGLADQSAQEGAPFSLDLSTGFSDPDGDALTFTAAGLPGSLSLSAGVVSGTPTRDDAAGSPYTVTVTADDGRGGRVSDEFELDVTALDRADLALESIDASPAPAATGTAVQWSFEVADNGPQPTGSVQLSIRFAGAALTIDPGTCTASTEADGQRVVCTLDPIQAGQTATATVAGTAAEAGDIYATATVSAEGGHPLDPNADNDTRAATLDVGAEIDAQPAQTLPGPPAAGVAVGDLDGDGSMDAVVAAGAGAAVELRLNQQDPGGLAAALDGAGASRRGLSAAPSSLDAAAGGPAVALADLDGDGDLDLVIAAAAGTPAHVFTNSGNGDMTAAGTIGDGADTPTAVATADFDGDGFADVAFANRGANTVYLGSGGAGFAAAPALDGPALDSRDVEVIDADGDGRPDLVFANANGPATLYLNQGGGRFAAAVDVDPGPATSVASGDFNGDGFPDLVLGRVSAIDGGPPADPVYLNDGSGGFLATTALGAAPTVDVLAGDVDGDGNADVVAINATGAHQVFTGDGSGGFSLGPALFVSPDPARAALASIGLGGHQDVVVVGKQGTSVFFNDGRGRFGLGDTTPPAIELVGAADMTVRVDETYEDPGAVVTDDVDGELTPTVDDPVDTKVIGTYTVTYTAVDSAGNAAAPVTRTVRVEARPASGGGGGGGGAGLLSVAALAGALALKKVKKGLTPLLRTGKGAFPGFSRRHSHRDGS